MEAKEKKFLTVGQIRKIAQAFPYLGLRTKNGTLFGVNSKSVFIGENKKAKDSDCAFVVSWVKLNFHEYISIKTPML